MKLTIIPIVIGAFGTVTKGLKKGPGGLVSWQTSGDYPEYNIIKNDLNTEKCPGDMRTLAVTQTPVKNHQLKVM